MIIPGLLGSFFLIHASLNMYIVSGFFLILHDILDTSDGEVARYNNSTSVFGSMMDSLVHLIVNSSIVFFTIYGISKEFLHLNFKTTYLISIIFSLFVILDQFIKILIKKFENFETKENIKFNFLFRINDIFFGNIAFFHLVLFLSLIDLLLFQEKFFILLYFFLYITFLPIKLFIRFTKMLKLN